MPTTGANSGAPQENPLGRATERDSTTDGLPVAPALDQALAAIDAPPGESSPVGRIALLSAIAILVAVAASAAAGVLVLLIALITDVAFHGKLGVELIPPWANTLGAWVIVVPVIGGLIVGAMARYGSEAIRGHGIPEAMEQVLTNQSRISPRLIFLKPVSSAVAIGTGGPFGAEGPIIATGGALGSLIGQLLHITTDERKTLLAAGAAAGMAAIFGTPVAAVLLAVELLLFEYRARSLVPVALAAAVATVLRFAVAGSAPAFAMRAVLPPTGEALALYIAVGAIVGVLSAGVSRSIYAVEELFERLPIHWMWWPALGAVAVGVVGWISPRTLGVGYDNIAAILSGQLVGGTLAALVLLKFLSWVVALGSGTSGGTLAPLCTLGGGAGALLGAGLAHLFPSVPLDPRVAALVGMASMFAGASRALLTSVVFAFETTRQPIGLLPILGGCSAAYLASLTLLRHTIMTEKLARRGRRVSSDYAADFLEQILVRDVCTREVVTLSASEPVEEVLDRIAANTPGSQHQGFPVLDDDGRLLGVVTRRDLLQTHIDVAARVGSLIHRVPVVAYEDSTVREAADHMVRANVGRLPIVSRADPRTIVGMLTRSDVLGAHEARLDASARPHRVLRLTAPFDYWRLRSERTPSSRRGG